MAKSGAAANGVGPTKEGRRLAERDFQDAIGDLGAQRMISRSLLTRAIGAFDPEVITFPRMYQMRKDAMIQLGLAYRKAPHYRAKWHIECEDPQIAAGVTEILELQWGAYTRMRFNKLDFGFQSGIKQFEYGTLSGTYEDPETGEAKPIWPSKNVQPVVLAPPIPLMPEWVTPKIENGKFVGINTNLVRQSGNTNEPAIPAEWCMWVVNEFEENFRNYYGYPLTGYAYRYWWSSWFRHHMEDRHFEMDADPALMVKYPVGKYTDKDGNVISNQIAALKMGDDLRGGATVAVPSDVYVDDQGKAIASSLWDASFLTGGENMQAFRKSAEYLDIMKLRATLAPEQALVEGKGGTSSRNVASAYHQIFEESLSAAAEEDDDDWNRHHLPQIVEANWGPDAPTVRKITTGFEEEDLELVKGLITAAFTADPNALPIDFDELLKKARIPVFSAKEQEERQEQADEEAEERQKKAEESAPEGEEQQADEGNEGAQANQLKASQPGRLRRFLPGRRGRKEPDDIILLASAKSGHNHGATIKAKPTKTAKREFRRRNQNQREMQKRMNTVAKQRYRAAVLAMSDALPLVNTPELKETDEDGKVKWALLFLALRKHLSTQTAKYDKAIQAELASMYHAAGASELQRLGLPLDSWDIAREDVQHWAQENAGRLIKTMDDTLVEQHLRPWLADQLAKAEQAGVVGQDFSNIDIDKLALAMTEKFESYPLWMAERVARTEARTGYNQSSLDMWDRIGVSEVQAYDGLGGKSGKTDEECLRRNGEIMDLSEARKADEEEHPNGTLGFIPHVSERKLKELRLEPGVLAMDIIASESPYAMNKEGLILGEDATA